MKKNAASSGSRLPNKIKGSLMKLAKLYFDGFNTNESLEKYDQEFGRRHLSQGTWIVPKVKPKKS